MSWTSLYFKTQGLNVFILGTGEVATRRANKFLDGKANVILAGDSLTQELKDKGVILASVKDVDKLVKWAHIVILASGDKELSNYVSEIAKDKLLNRADFPDKGNIIVPTSFNIGDVEVSIFTNGKSPLMARQLRKKIQENITKEDLIEIELQDYSRNLLKEKIRNQKERKDYLYKIFQDEHINTLIKSGEYNKAKEYINRVILGDFHHDN